MSETKEAARQRVAVIIAAVIMGAMVLGMIQAGWVHRVKASAATLAESSGLGTPVRIKNYEVHPVSARLVKEVGAWNHPQSSDTRDLAEIIAGDVGWGVGEVIVSGLFGLRGDKDKDAFVAVEVQVKNAGTKPRTADDIEFRLIDAEREYYFLDSSYSSIGHRSMMPNQLYTERLVFRTYSTINSYRLVIGDRVYPLNDLQLLPSDPPKGN